MRKSPMLAAAICAAMATTSMPMGRARGTPVSDPDPKPEPNPEPDSISSMDSTKPPTIPMPRASYPVDNSTLENIEWAREQAQLKRDRKAAKRAIR